jgi:5-methylcytosine-specific restriction enzyme subunit McrC
MERLELQEFVPCELERDALDETVARQIHMDGRYRVSVDPPSFRTNGKWRLTSQGWVGLVPVDAGPLLVLTPRVPILNLFGMLEYAYSLRSFRFLDGMVDSESLESLLERLAAILAGLTLTRGRRGFYRTYVGERERLPYLRGRMELEEQIRAPWQTHLMCQYEEHTSDVEENQILAWTLRTVSRSGICTARTAPQVRRSGREISSFARPLPHPPSACSNRTYNRLNDDYEPMHALCRFFLDHCGPTHNLGDRRVIPFVVDMAALFERFVAEWLKKEAPARLGIWAQRSYAIDQGLRFQMDVVVEDARTKRPLLVLDTKYKLHEQPSAEDVAQVVAYAEALGCSDAVLVYPRELQLGLDCRVGEIRVRSIGFPLDGDLETAGKGFLDELLCKEEEA